MLHKFITYLILGKRFCGIEISSRNSKDTFLVTSLRKRKKELTIDMQFEVESVDLIAEKLPKKQHVFLIVNTNHVLFKKVTTSNTNQNAILNGAFPNINTHDFYYEIISGNNNTSFIALCRKNYVDTIIDDFKAKNIFVTSFSLSNNLITEITNFVTLKSIQSSNAQVTLDGEIKDVNITDTINKQEEYDVNGLLTANKYILSLSGALTAFLNTNNRISNSEEKINSLFQDFKHQILFKKGLQGSLIVFLVALLLNFFLFNHYFSKVNELQQTSQVNTINKNAVLSLDKKLKKTEKIATDILKSSASKSSFYVNEIIKLIPNSILLSELNYQPLQKRIKKNQNILIQNNTIIISGVSSESESFSNWIKQLENYEWVKTVDIHDYSDTSTSRTEFSIKLNLSHEE